MCLSSQANVTSDKSFCGNIYIKYFYCKTSLLIYKCFEQFTIPYQCHNYKEVDNVYGRSCLGGCSGECDCSLPGFLIVFCSSVGVVSSHWSGVGRFVSIGQVLLSYCFVCLGVQEVWVVVFSVCIMTLFPSLQVDVCSWCDGFLL